MTGNSGTSNCDGYPPISDYALIGNCRTAALISRDGSIDWYCPDRFDAPAVFCRILDRHKGGYFSIAPAGKHTTTRRYDGDTNILQTTHDCGDARLVVTDFMPIQKSGPKAVVADPLRETSVVRGVHAEGGPVEVRIELKPTFNYAASSATFDDVQGNGVLARSDDLYLGLSCHGAEQHDIEDGTVRMTVQLKPGERRFFRLIVTKDRDKVLHELQLDTGADDLKLTENFWKEWASHCSYRGRYRAEVMRSALTLKLLTYDPTGAIVAAPTTSLPEELGGVRNWDYRFTWLRDSSLILFALASINYQETAARFITWLRETLREHRRTCTEPHLMYTLDGEAHIPERELPNLEGYCCSRPVRIGNAASDQRQLDIYGEVLVAAYIHYHHPSEPTSMEVSASPPNDESWSILRELVEDAVTMWQEPDNGIWEVRGGMQDFLYSKLMCWAAVDRGIKLAEEFKLEADLDRWKSARDDMRQAIEEKGFNRKLGAFTQAFGSDDLDASVLAIPRIGFLPGTDPRVLSTIDCLQKNLSKDGFLYRYSTKDTADGLPGGEGTFLLCTFWMIQALALAGRGDEARSLFDKAVARANDVGLFSEELEAGTGVFLGNFPQGFTHLALIGAAVDLAVMAKHGPQTEAHTEAHRAHKGHKATSEGHS